MGLSLQYFMYVLRTFCVPCHLFICLGLSLAPWFLGIWSVCLEKPWKSLGKSKYQGILIDRIDSFVSPGTACVIIDVNLSLNCTPGDRWVKICTMYVPTLKCFMADYVHCTSNNVAWTHSIRGCDWTNDSSWDPRIDKKGSCETEEAGTFWFDSSNL